MLFGIAAIGIAIGYYHYKKNVIVLVQEAARKSVQVGERSITKELNVIEQKGDTLAGHLANGFTVKYEQSLKRYLTETKSIVSIGVIDKTKDHITAWAQRYPYSPVKQIKQMSYVDLAKKHHWQDGVSAHAQWNKTYLGGSSDYVLIDYTAPIKNPATGRADSILFITYSTEILTDHILSIQVAKSGYSFVVLPRGQFIIHPFHNYVLKEKNIFAHAQAERDPGLIELSKRLKDKGNGEINYVNKKTGQQAWIIYRTIDKTKWVLAGIFFLNELYREYEAPLRHLFLIMILVWLFFLLGLLALFLRVYTGNIIKLWHFSITSSVLFSIAIGLIWHVTYNRTFIPLKEVVVVDKSALHDYLHEVKILRDKYHLIPSVQIPTGVFILKTQFTDNNNVDFSGIIWQRYKKEEHDHIKRGFFFPDALGGGSDIKEIYHIHTDEEEVIGWKFSSVVMQFMDPQQYPLDALYIKLRVWHDDFEKNVFLIPDLDGYSFTNPLLLPGLDPSLKFKEWDLRRSFYSYTLNDYRSNFGIPETSVYNVMPELTYNIGLQRKVYNVLISILFPLLGAAFMLFASLLAFTRDQQLMAVSGFNTLAVLAVASALFFTLISSHLSLRTSLQVQGIIYLDYFYLVLYFALFAISMLSVLFVIDKEAQVIQYKNSLIVKLIFWPFITGVLMFITWGIFY